MKIKINNLIITLTLLISFNVISQEKISIVVLKGYAILQKSTTESIKINRGKKLTFPENSLIVINKNSSAILYNSTAKIEIGTATEKKFSYIEINKLLKKNKSTTLTKNFIAYLDKMYTDLEAQNNSYGVSIGAVSRGGVEDENSVYSPIDETIILSDSLVLSFGSKETKLTSNIVVTNTTNNEVVYNDKPINNWIKLNNLKTGNYTWNYKIESDEKSITFSNTFIIPSSIEKEAKLKEIANFKTNLNDCATSETCLTDDTKEVLLSDFLEKNKYYLKK
jgi:hypothetical protein